MRFSLGDLCPWARMARYVLPFAVTLLILPGSSADSARGGE
jgi:hypothetical protein